MWKNFNRNLLSRINTECQRAASIKRTRVSLADVCVSGQPPLNEPLPNFVHSTYLNSKSIELSTTKLTVLPNGLRVATEPVFGEYCTLGAAINAGARYEALYPPGTCHFLEKLAFTDSVNFPNGVINEILERCGALVDCQSTRDTFLYASSCHIKSIEQVVSIIADTIQRPIISPDHIEHCKEMIENENAQLARTPECEPLLTDWFHEAAFRGNTVGFSKYCRPEHINSINIQHLFSYLSQYYTPDRIVLAGIGVDHNLLVELGGRFFKTEETSWTKNPELVFSNLPPLDNSKAQYSGGEIRIERDLSKMALGPTPFPNLAHLVLGFECVSLSHPDFVAFCVLQSLLGGGGSFSAGGPGKGMFTRLYVDVLHHHGWIYNATAYNHSYTDTGTFCIRASASPNFLDRIPEIIIHQFRRIVDRKDIGDSELDRAKVQLKSQLMMNLEMRPVMFEDLARQILIHDRRKKAQEYVEAIDQIQAADIVRVGERMLNSKLSLVGYGDLRKLPNYEKIRLLVH